MPVKNRFAEMLPEITAWRREFHENPELLYEVHRTAARVAALHAALSEGDRLYGDADKAEAALMATTSYMSLVSKDITVTMTWTSLRRPLTKVGRRGRSI